MSYSENDTRENNRCLILVQKDDLNYDFKVEKCEEYIEYLELLNLDIIDNLGNIEKYDNLGYIVVYDYSSFGSIMEILKSRIILDNKKIGLCSFLNFTKISGNWSANGKFKFNLSAHLTDFLENYDLEKALKELEYLDNLEDPPEVEFMMKSLLENRRDRLIEIKN